MRSTKRSYGGVFALMTLTIIISTTKDAYSANCLIQIGADVNTGAIQVVKQAGAGALVGAEAGLFRLAGDELIPIGVESTEAITVFR